MHHTHRLTILEFFSAISFPLLYIHPLSEGYPKIVILLVCVCTQAIVQCAE